MADEKNDAEGKCAEQKAPPEADVEIVDVSEAANEPETLAAETPPPDDSSDGASARPGEASDAPAPKKGMMTPVVMLVAAVVVIGAVSLGVWRPWEQRPSIAEEPAEAAAPAPADAEEETAPQAQMNDVARPGDALAQNDRDEAPPRADAGDETGAGGTADGSPASRNIANDVAALKEELRTQMDELNEELGEERARAQALEQEIAVMRRELQAAIAARENFANEELASLREDFEKLRNDGGLAVTRRAAAGVALNDLQSAVDSGRPFAAALDAFARLAPDAPQLASLHPYAAVGAPSPEALREDLAAAARAGLAAAGRARAGNFWSRLWARAKNLISVRPAAPRPGADPQAVMSRAEAYIAEGDAAAAISEIETLPAEAQAAMSVWLDAARARAAADAALDALRAAYSAPAEE